MEQEKIWVKCSLLGCFAGIICVIFFKYIEIIVSYCNSNQGFFSALLGFLAITISIVTFCRQKKFQIDLQLRQIKLDSFEFRLQCWEELSYLIAGYTSLLIFIEDELDKLNNFGGIDVVTKVKILPRIDYLKKHGDKIRNRLIIMEFLVNDIDKKLVQEICYNFINIVCMQESEKLYENVRLYKNKIRKDREFLLVIKEKLENDLDLYNIHKL